MSLIKAFPYEITRVKNCLLADCYEKQQQKNRRFTLPTSVKSNPVTFVKMKQLCGNPSL